MASKVIFLAEDDYSYRTILSEFLEDLGYPVTTAINKTEILERARVTDLWILDIMLEDDRYAGIQAVRELAERGVCPRNEIIFMSNFGLYGIMNNEHVFLEQHNIPFCWMDKPVNLDQLSMKAEGFFRVS